MAGFSYILNVTGDCSYQGVGVVSVLPVDGTPPYTVEWVNPSLPPIEYTTTTPSIRGSLFPGVYTIRLSDSSQPENFAFDLNAIVSSGVCASIVNVNSTSCNENNGSVTAATDSYLSSVTFYLNTSGGTQLNSVVSDTGSAVFVGLSAGTYNVTVEDIGGCTAKTSDFIILNSSVLDFGFYTVPNSACENIDSPLGKIYVTGQTGTPPYTYFWSNNQTGSTITGLTEGFYSCTLTDANGCSITKNTEVTTVPSLGLVEFTATTPSCFSADGSLTMFISGGTGPYYYSASTGNVLISYAKNFTLSNIPAGNYSFVVTDAGLCQLVASSNLQTPQSIGEITVTGINSTCSQDNGSIQIFVNQGISPFTYTIVYPDSTSQSVTTNSPSYFFENLSTGTYGIIIQNPQQCVYEQDVTIIAENLFDVFTFTTGTTCNLDNGSVYIEITTGGTAPFTYNLNNVDYFVDTSLTSVTINNIASGSYPISVTDANGCSRTKSILIGSSTDVDFSLYSTECGNGSEGSITAFITSGAPPFSFQWSENVPSNPQTITVNNLTAGTYSLTLIDSNGCSFTRSTEINCNSVTSGYVSFNVGSLELVPNSQTYTGLLQMLNDGYQDLVEGNTNCILNTTTFVAIVEVNPVGLLLQDNYYFGTSLVDVPSNNQWSTAVETLLMSVPGIQSVNIDSLTNQVSITKIPGNTYLNGQVISIKHAIEYDINC